jgi:hypothetical protein
MFMPTRFTAFLAENGQKPGQGMDVEMDLTYIAPQHMADSIHYCTGLKAE